jgi:hypothetical protein
LGGAGIEALGEGIMEDEDEVAGVAPGAVRHSSPSIGESEDSAGLLCGGESSEESVEERRRSGRR